MFCPNPAPGFEEEIERCDRNRPNRDFSVCEKEKEWYDEAVRSRAGWSTFEMLQRDTSGMCSSGSQGCDV